MKKNILIYLFLFQFFNSFGQILDCPVSFSNNYNTSKKLENFDQSNLALPPTSQKFVINVKFHIVKNAIGDTPSLTSNFGESEVMNAIMILNTTFNSQNIFFKYMGFDVIRNTQFTKISNMLINTTPAPSFQELVNYSNSMPNPVYLSWALNIFIVDKIDENSTTLLPQTAGLGVIEGWDSVFSYDYFLTATLPHEIGHNLSLLHIYEGYNTSNCEHVSGNNSATAGDLVTDTPASRPISDINVTSSCGFINNASVSDCLGVQYNNVPVKNFMGSWNTCRQLGTGYLPGNAQFSQGQFNKMRMYLSQDAIGYFGTVESLYEPFDEQPVYGDILSVTDNVPGDGMANVCRSVVGINYRFQQGFTYDFSNIYDGSAISS